MSRESIEKNLLICLKKTSKKHKFEYSGIKEGENIFVVRLNSFEKDWWFIKLRKEFFKTEDENIIKNIDIILQGVFFHEIGHYFYRDRHPKTQKEEIELEEEVDNFVKVNWVVEEEIDLMRKVDMVLKMTLKPESYRLDDFEDR